jgi:tetratricopeptide (TPR) repeat protein
MSGSLSDEDNTDDDLDLMSEAVVECEPQSHAMAMYQGSALCRLGREADAIERFGKALLLAAPGAADEAARAYLARGNALYSLRRTDEAVADWEHALDTPGNIMPSCAKWSSVFAVHAADMPRPVKLLLVDRVTPSAVDAEELLGALASELSELALASARKALRSADTMLCRRGVLTPRACARLRLAVDASLCHSCFSSDSIDGAPDYQRNLSREELEELVGAADTEALMRLPGEFTSGVQGEGEHQGNSTFGCFIRRYTRGTRPWIPFHCDSASITVNVALNDDADFEGGTLLGVHDGAVAAIVREEGEATVHPSTLLHAVTAMTAGARYSLILFFNTCVVATTDHHFTAVAAERARRHFATATAD